MGEPSCARRDEPLSCTGPPLDPGDSLGSISSSSGAMKYSHMAGFCRKELSRSSNPKVQVRFYSFSGFVTLFPAWQLGALPSALLGLLHSPSLSQSKVKLGLEARPA